MGRCLHALLRPCRRRATWTAPTLERAAARRADGRPDRRRRHPVATPPSTRRSGSADLEAGGEVRDLARHGPDEPRRGWHRRAAASPRAERLVAGNTTTTPSRSGYVLIPVGAPDTLRRRCGGARNPCSRTCWQIAERFGDRDLSALGRLGLGKRAAPAGAPRGRFRAARRGDAVRDRR